jgi:hypothetical protein
VAPPRRHRFMLAPTHGSVPVKDVRAYSAMRQIRREPGDPRMTRLRDELYRRAQETMDDCTPMPRWSTGSELGSPD